MTSPARRLWMAIEPLHALVYFAPEVPAAYEAVGLPGFWRGYFAGRAAPMGRVEASPVTAAFFGFHPDFVARAVPDVWSRADPATVLAARLDGIDAAMRPIGLADDDRSGTVADLLVDAMAELDPGGRPLFAANRDLEAPDVPHLRLWQAATTCREHRGDGHVAALVAHGLNGAEAHCLRLAVDGSPPESIRPYRGWSDEDWAAAAERLVERGLLRGGRVTDAGLTLHRDVERLTDALAQPLLDELDGAVDALLDTLTPLTALVTESGTIPYPNPMGLPPPTT